MLPRRHIAGVLADIALAGYSCAHTHGARGERGRTEVGGVAVCYDAAQVRLLAVSRATGETQRTIVRGRVLQLRLGFLGSRSSSSSRRDVDLLAAYMPPRGTGRRGHESAALREGVERAWRRLTEAAMRLAGGRTLMVAGDLNAEPPDALRLRRGGAGAVATPSDIAMEHAVDVLPLGRLHEVEDGSWTYRSTSGQQVHWTHIDHMYVSGEIEQLFSNSRVVDGVERGSWRHRALTTVYAPAMDAIEDWGGTVATPAKVCRWEGASTQQAFDACKRIYRARVEQAVSEAIEEQELEAEAAGRSSRVRDVLMASQRGQMAAMALAVRLVEAGDVLGERRDRQEQERRERATRKRSLFGA